MELPEKFDLIVIGTGMIESIIAAAASRIGKNVLHVDSNDYYGGMWASFNLEGIEKYIVNPQVSLNKPSENNTKFINDCEQILNMGNDLFGIRNVSEHRSLLKPSTSSSKMSETEINADSSAKTNSEEQYKNDIIDTIVNQYRKFNLDLAPKLQFARGIFVELLISSNIARYSEYRSVSRVLTWLNGHLEVVPCSRSDVFSNSRVTVVEKRMLMKLLTACMDTDDSAFDGYHSKTFYQYLKDRKLTSNLIHYVLYAIAMSNQNTPCLEGVAKTKRFLNSLGKFGKTPFLFSMYGSGELPQAFCRLCAVFGGTYCLNRPINSLILDQNNKFSGIICGNQKITAENLVLSAEKVPGEFTKSCSKQNISRVIFVTDKSILNSDKENLTLLLFPPENGKNPVTVIELGSTTGTCPVGTYVVHMYCKENVNPKEDFAHCVKSLLHIPKEQNVRNMSKTLPNVLWSLYFTLTSTENCDSMDGLPENMYPCAGPDLDLDYDESVKNAKKIFLKLYPDADFLPRAPDPEEIIINDNEDEGNPEEISQTS